MATAASRSFTLTAGQRRLGAKLVGAVLSLSAPDEPSLSP